MFLFQKQLFAGQEKERGHDCMMQPVDAYQGSLSDYSLSDVLISLQRNTKTGVVEVKSGNTIKKVYVNKGDIVFAASNDKDDRLGVVLLKEGKISLEQYVQASGILEKTGKRLGKILVEINALTAKDLFEVVCHQIEEITLSLFTMRDGEFEFIEDPIITGEVITLKISTANIIYRGIKRIDNFMHIAKMCPSIDSVITLSSDPLNIFQDLNLEDSDKTILSFINGRDPLKTILKRSDLTDFETLRTIYTLLSIGLIKPKEEDDTPVDISAVDLLAKPAEPVTPEFTDEVTWIFEKCDAYGYYEILGVNKDTSSEEISKAYYDVSKKYHPDRHYSQPCEDLKEKLTKIFAYIHRAHDTLSDPEKRADYDSMLAEELTTTETPGEEIGEILPVANGVSVTEKVEEKVTEQTEEEETVSEEKVEVKAEEEEVEVKAEEKEVEVKAEEEEVEVKAEEKEVEVKAEEEEEISTIEEDEEPAPIEEEATVHAGRVDEIKPIEEDEIELVSRDDKTKPIEEDEIILDDVDDKNKLIEEDEIELVSRDDKTKPIEEDEIIFADGEDEIKPVEGDVSIKTEGEVDYAPDFTIPTVEKAVSEPKEEYVEPEAAVLETAGVSQAEGAEETISGDSITLQKRSFRKVLTVVSVIVAVIASVLVIMFFNIEDEIGGYPDKTGSVISTAKSQSGTLESGHFPSFRDDVMRKFAESVAAGNALGAGSLESGHFPSFRDDAVLKLLNDRPD